MQIHELNTFPGIPGDTDFLAIDTGFDTAKISVPKLYDKKVNQPVDENNQPDNGNDGEVLRTKGDGRTEWAPVGQPTDAQTAQAVTDWLDAHPEATTTVQDGSLTIQKFVTGELGFVTPELFGAVGDGSNDDTDALQTALNTAPVMLKAGSSYKITKTIFINHSLIGNGGSIIISDTITPIKPAAPNDLEYGVIMVNVPNITIDNLTIIGPAESVNDCYPINSNPQGPSICVTDGGDNCCISECIVQNAEGHAFMTWGHDIKNVVFENCIAENCGIGFSLETRNDDHNIDGNPTNISFLSCFAKCCMGCAISAVNGIHVINCYFESTNAAASQINIQEVDENSIVEVSGSTFIHDGQNITTGVSRALTLTGGTNGRAFVSFNACRFEYKEAASSGWFGIYLGGKLNNCTFVNCSINTPISIPNISKENTIEFIGCEIKIPSSFTSYFCNVLNTQTKLSFKNCIIDAVTGIYAGSDFSVCDCVCTFSNGRLFALVSTNPNIKGYCLNNTLSMTQDNAYGTLPIGTIILLNNKNVGAFTGAINGGYLIGAWPNASSFPTGLPYQMAVETSTHKLYVCYGSSWYDAMGNIRS